MVCGVAQCAYTAKILTMHPIVQFVILVIIIQEKIIKWKNNVAIVHLKMVIYIYIYIVYILIYYIIFYYVGQFADECEMCGVVLSGR